MNNVSLGTPITTVNGMLNIYNKYKSDEYLQQKAQDSPFFVGVDEMQRNNCLNMYPPYEFVNADDQNTVTSLVVQLHLRAGVENTLLPADTLCPVEYNWCLPENVKQDLISLLGSEETCMQVLQAHLNILVEASALCSQFLYIVIDTPMCCKEGDIGLDVCAFTRLSAVYYQVLQFLRSREITLQCSNSFNANIAVQLPYTYTPKSVSVRHHVLICDTVNGYESDILTRVKNHSIYFAGLESAQNLQIRGTFDFTSNKTRTLIVSSHRSSGIEVKYCFFHQFEGSVVGGTFDQLHEGHHQLLALTAYSSAGRVCVGLSTDELLSKKKLAQFLYSYDVRLGAIKQELFLFGASSVDVHAQRDSYGPSASEAHQPVLVLSEEFRTAIPAVSTKRYTTRCEYLDALVCPLIVSTTDDARNDTDLDSKISSSIIRATKHVFCSTLAEKMQTYLSLVQLELQEWKVKHSLIEFQKLMNEKSIYSVDSATQLRIYITLVEQVRQYIHHIAGTIIYTPIYTPKDQVSYLQRMTTPHIQQKRVQFLLEIQTIVCKEQQNSP